MFTWKILNTLRNAADGGIVEALVEVLGETEDGSASVRAKASFVPVADDPAFLPFFDVTEDIIIGWAKAALGEAVMEQKVRTEIAEQLKTRFVTGLPWSN